ncbi:hypothetical protein HHI36_013256 [Cryptolaemus montrouzieri]|uniref:Uncharacterized protein n=1 Tax=Cryptolaemus montrouzieri TaxID=559131 RepID=A0ABD2NH78_9CUCU
MPGSLVANQRQLKTEQANQARLITIQNWIVGSRNGHIKSVFKFLDGVIPRAHVLNLKDFYSITGVLINKYHEPIRMDGKTPELAEILKNRMNETNILQEYVTRENLKRRNATWIRINENDIQEFPILHME